MYIRVSYTSMYSIERVDMTRLRFLRQLRGYNHETLVAHVSVYCCPLVICQLRDF